jgi:hypothetical protein
MAYTMTSRRGREEETSETMLMMMKTFAGAGSNASHSALLAFTITREAGSERFHSSFEMKIALSIFCHTFYLSSLYLLCAVSSFRS